MINYLSNAKPATIRGTALLRLDFNTKDDWRMRAVLPTLNLLLRRSAKIVVLSHYGRPSPVSSADATRGRGLDKKFSLKKDAETLGRLLKKKVIFIPHFNFPVIKKMIDESPRGSIFLLENLRFLKGEEANDAGFAKSLASLGDFYVNDAFAVSHRANASVAAITKLLPKYAGLELEREIISLSKAQVKPKHPLILILGGAKAGDKLGVITYFKNKADWFLLGGGPADTILFLEGMNVGRSVRDTDPNDLKKIKTIAKYKNIIVPEDYRWSRGAILDLGPKSTQSFIKKIAKARTILWSGPLGLFEKPAFAKGDIMIAKAIIKNRRAFSIAGGGETVMFLKRYKLDKKFSFISTGGGAMVDFLAGEKLPGIEALKQGRYNF